MGVGGIWVKIMNTDSGCFRAGRVARINSLLFERGNEATESN